MTTASVSSDLEKINSILREHNPFIRPPALRAPHVWDEGLPDIESLNAHASDAVFNALDDIRAGHYSATSIVISAEKGTGKTHVISRIRHRLQKQGGALFVFANYFDDIDDIGSSFQKLLAESLSHTGAKGVSQWQELATEITNSVLKNKKPEANTVQPRQLIQKFEKSSNKQVINWINHLTKSFCRGSNTQDPDVVKAILWNLSPDQATYAVDWLGGKELAKYKANELQLPLQRKSFSSTLKILKSITQFNELVICFDELEDTTCVSSSGLQVAQSVGFFIKKLFENLDRGVILTALHTAVWMQSIKGSLPKSVPEKMSAHGKPYELEYMDSNSVIEFVASFLNRFYASQAVAPPHSVYPFQESVLKEKLGKQRPTVRAVLKWCKEEFYSSVLAHGSECIENLETKNEAQEAFVLELNAIMDSYWEQNKQIGNALLFSFQNLVSYSLEGIKVSEVTDRVKGRGRKDPYLNFKIIGEENGGNTCIGVAVLQDDGGRGLGAGFKRLLDKKGEFNITRGCLVRSQEKSLNRYFKDNYLEPLIHTQGGEWVDLLAEEIRPLIAIHNVYRKRDEYDLTEERIFEFIENADPELLLGIHSPLLQEILSAPSNQVPDIIDEPESENFDAEAFLEQPLESNSTDVTPEEDSDTELDLLEEPIDDESSENDDDFEELTKGD